MTGAEYVKALEAKLVAQGLPMVESLAEKVYAAVRETDLEAAAASGNPLIQMIVPVAQKALDGVVGPILNKISTTDGD
jgi:hypothetical protein